MNWLENLMSKIPGFNRLPKPIQSAIVAFVLAIVGYFVRYFTGKDVETVEVVKIVEVEKFVPVAEPQPPIVGAPQMLFGWIEPTPLERMQALAIIKANQNGLDPDFSKLAKAAIEAADADDPVFFWEAETKVLKKQLPVWNQGNIGSCVSHGVGRAAQDTILSQIASGAAEEWPGAEVCREAIYGGSRVEIGGGRIRGDGSINAWAVAWLQKYGVLFYKAYPSQDLSGGYSVSRCREWGQRGCPDDLEPIARQHAIKTVAAVKNAEEVWVAIGNGYPVCIASNVGFQSPLKDGFCARRGSWPHSMEVAGRFMHPQKGKCFVIRNSWGDYLSGDRGQNFIDVVGRTGKVELPAGCFGCTAADMDVVARQADSFALSGFVGFPRQRIDWSVRRFVPIEENLARAREPQFALAP